MNQLEDVELIPLTIKELAAGLGHNRTYVHAMKRKGFMMPGNRACIRDAKAWLVRNPPPRASMEVAMFV